MQRRFFKPYFLLLAIFLVTTGFHETAISQTTFNGNLQNYNAFQSTGDLQFLTGRNRLGFEANRSISQGRLVIGGNLFHRYTIDNENDFDTTELILRKAYIDLYFSNADLRAGFQNISFGRTVGPPVTDIITPIDLREFPTMEQPDLLLGLAALNLTYYFENNYLQFILSPGFRANRIPDASSRWFPEPEFPEFVPIQFIREEPGESLKNLNIALRYAWRRSLSYDLDVLLYHWSHPAPAYKITVDFSPMDQLGSIDLTESYRNSLMAGTSLSWRFAERFELHSDALMVHRRLFTYLPVPVSELEEVLEDPLLAIQLFPEFLGTADGFVLEKPWFHLMLGLKYQTGGWSISGQMYLEHILDYEENILPREYFPYATSTVRKSYFRDRLTTLIHGQYNFYGEDFRIQAETDFEWREDLFFSAGVNLFGGPEISPFYGHFTFNRYQENSFIYFKLTTYF